MNELIQEYVKNCCSVCKSEHCNKAIVISEYNNMYSVKCANYEKDKSKIQGYVKPVYKTADIEACLMPKLWSSH